MEIKLKNKATGKIFWVNNASEHFGWYDDFCGWDTLTDFYSLENYEEVPQQ